MHADHSQADSRLTGDDLRLMFSYAQDSLEMHASLINALNVFPVPDGDTGTNMSLTVKAVEERLASMEGAPAGDVARTIAQESLLSARGNSGVILSQFFKGLSLALDGIETFGGKEMADALLRASEQAYKAVSQPKEGTMLTVVREAGRTAEAAIARGDTAPLSVWEQACHGARRALAETPDLLPVLKEAGVVDSGGLGVLAMMEGALAYLRGHEVRPLDFDVGNTAPTTTYLTATEEDAFGYCTQLLIAGQDMDVDEARTRISTLAQSTVVVGDSETIKVHCHALDPGPIISYAVSLGSLSQVKIENMDQQHVGFMEMHRGGPQAASVPLGVVAVAAGMGIEQIFRDYGALAVVAGGQTMNPSTRDLADTADLANAATVILLPNNSNIVGTAQQAAAVAGKPLYTVPTVSIPQGIAALLAFNPDLDAAANLKIMRDAASRVRSGEVTRAVRTTSADGVAVREGQAIALLEGKLVAASGAPNEALVELCRLAAPPAGSLITLYWGGDATEALAREAAETLRAAFPAVDVEVVFGGQPHYEYLVGIE